MISAKFRGTLLLFFFLLTIADALPKLAGQAKQPPAGNQPVNLFKEVLDHKSQIQWKPAPPPGIPTDVCLMLKVCEGQEEAKFAALPRTTEGGQPVGRGLLLSGSRDPKNPEAVLLEHQTVSELYFFLLSPDGNLQKGAYIQQGGSAWLPVGSAVAGPVFEKDRNAWHEFFMKLGAAGK
jgi:hypothetical protein